METVCERCLFFRRQAGGSDWKQFVSNACISDDRLRVATGNSV